MVSNHPTVARPRRLSPSLLEMQDTSRRPQSRFLVGVTLPVPSFPTVPTLLPPVPTIFPLVRTLSITVPGRYCMLVSTIITIMTRKKCTCIKSTNWPNAEPTGHSTPPMNCSVPCGTRIVYLGSRHCRVTSHPASRSCVSLVMPTRKTVLRVTRTVCCGRLYKSVRIPSSR